MCLFCLFRKQRKRISAVCSTLDRADIPKTRPCRAWASSQQIYLAIFPKQIIRISDHYLCWCAFELYNSYFFIYFLHFTVYAVRTLEWHIFSLGTYPRHMLYWAANTQGKQSLSLFVNYFIFQFGLLLPAWHTMLL